MTMNLKNLLIAAAVLTASHLAAYHFGREAMRAEILSAPVARDTTVKYVYLPAVPETLHGTPRQNLHNRATFAQVPPAGAGAGVPTSPAEIIDETGQNEALAYSYADTLFDHAGGSHALTFTYPTLAFGEVYTPGPDSIGTVTVTEKVYVPADEPAFWLTGHAAYLGAGLSAGYNAVGVGCLWMNGQKPAPFISYTVRF
jgi:hypothetical protein